MEPEHFGATLFTGPGASSKTPSASVMSTRFNKGELLLVTMIDFIGGRYTEQRAADHAISPCQARLAGDRDITRGRLVLHSKRGAFLWDSLMGGFWEGISIQGGGGLG